VTKARSVEFLLLAVLLAAQAYLFARPLHSAVNYDEAVYLAAVDALRHGQALGTSVFAAQFPGFYDLLRGLTYLAGISVAPVRAGLIGVTLLGSVGGYLLGRRFGGAVGGLLAVALLTIAPPLDLFGFQVIADTPSLALTALALGIATVGGVPAALLAGAVFAAGLSVKLTALTAAPAVLWLLGRRRIVPALIGFSAVAAIVLVTHVRALGELWASGVTYHSDARSTPSVIPHPHRQILDQIPHGTPFFVLGIVAVIVAGAALALRRPLTVWPLWSWVVLSVAFLFLHAPLHYNHLIVFPYTLAIAVAATIGAAVHRLPPAAARVALGVLVVAVVGGFVQQIHRVDLARAGEPRSNVAAAHALQRLTRPQDRTIDDRPIISFLAHRRVLGPLVDLAALRFETGSLTDREVIRDLGEARAVVISRSLREHPAILIAVRKEFVLRYDRGGVLIWIKAPTPNALRPAQTRRVSKARAP
jgi:hypothetical protein